MKFLLLFGFLCSCRFEFVSAEKPFFLRILLPGKKAGPMTETAGRKKGFFAHCIEPPIKCPSKYVTFWYYSRNNPDKGILIPESEEVYDFLPRSNNTWKLIYHGHQDTKDDRPNKELRPAYFARGDYNIISVDYSPLTQRKCYIQAVRNVPLIAKCTAQFLDGLVDKGYLTLDNLHAIGYSLGAQIAGRIHKYLKHGKPLRITGLDPTGILFDKRLHPGITKQAGRFVDVIHTNTLWLGEVSPIGHVDFYVNGGLMQPGCLTSKNDSILTCSHGRSPQYFAESINSPEGFWGVPCQRLPIELFGFCKTLNSPPVLMGEDVPLTTRGVYYVPTHHTAPFAMGRPMYARFG